MLFIAVVVISHPIIIFVLIFIFEIVDIVFNVTLHIIATKSNNKATK